MAKMREKMDKLKKDTEEQGINISEDALFIVNEIRDTRNTLLIFLSVIIGLIIAFGIANLTLLIHFLG